MIKVFANKVDYEVPKDLQTLVVGFIQGKAEKTVNEAIPIYATGFPLVFYIFGDKPFLTINGQKQQTKSRLNVAGQICNAKIIFHIEGIFEQLGVVLHPTALYYLFHKTGDKFLNSWKPLRESSTIETKELIQKLAEDNSLQKRISHITKYLRLLEKQRIPPIRWLDASLEKIFSTNGNISQDELVKESHVTKRHYRRIFKKVIGVSPKYYCKVIQLATVFELLNNSEDEKLHRLALDCGYYDQSHFIHNFHKLIRESPENFLNGPYSDLKYYLGRK